MLDWQSLLKKMRSCAFRENRITITNAFVKHINADPRRMALIFPGIGNEFSIWSIATPTGTIDGFTNPANAPNVVLTIWDHGPLVTQGWYGRAQTGGFITSWYEVLDLDT